MRILAVDTALGACSVAILNDQHLAAHRFVFMERGHAEALAPMVDDAMSEAGLAFADLDRLAVTTGPGTFTGQRVGIAFMRGLKLALDRPLIGVTTLEAMAAAAEEEAGIGPVAVLQDARRGEVYGALFSGERIHLPVKLSLFDEMMDEIATATGSSPSLVLAGTAADKGAKWLQARGRAVSLSTICQPDALQVARLAAKKSATTITARPLYLRASDAKVPAGAIRIRVANINDADLLANLNAASLIEPWDAKFFLGVLEHQGGLGLIAEAHGVPVGFVLVRSTIDETEVLALAVSMAFRRNGIGRRLLRMAAEKVAAGGSAKLFLEVASNNAPAQKLYESQGFQKVGRRKAYYSNGQDAVVLQVPLPLSAAGLGNPPKVD